MSETTKEMLQLHNTAFPSRGGFRGEGGVVVGGGGGGGGGLGIEPHPALTQNFISMGKFG